MKLKICRVCSLLDNDNSLKLCRYCSACSSWICIQDWYRLDRRAKAKTKDLFISSKQLRIERMI
jgi:hypothetical protein